MGAAPLGRPSSDGGRRSKHGRHVVLVRILDGELAETLGDFAITAHSHSCAIQPSTVALFVEVA